MISLRSVISFISVSSQTVSLQQTKNVVTAAASSFGVAAAVPTFAAAYLPVCLKMFKHFSHSFSCRGLFSCCFQMQFLLLLHFFLLHF